MAQGTLYPFKGQPKVGDFFAPFFSVRFLSPTAVPAKKIETGGFIGNAFAKAAQAARNATAVVETDTTQNGEVVVSKGDTKIIFSDDAKTSQFRSYATRLTITNQGGAANSCELVLEPSLDDALIIIDQQLIQWNSIMLIEWGYTSNDVKDEIISDTHYFIIMQPRLEMHGTDVTITITGVDMFSASSTKREDRRVYPRVAFPTDATILAQIAAKNNFRLNFALTNEESLIRLNKPLNPKEPKFIEQNEKDWIFFGRLCDMNNTTFFTQGDTICLVDQNIARRQQTSYRLLFYTQPATQQDIPMYSFSTAALVPFFFPAAAKEISATHSDPDKGTSVTQKFDPTKMPDHVTLGTRTASGKDEADGRSVKVADKAQIVPNPKFTPTETGKHFSHPAQKANRDEHAKQVTRTASVLANQNATCTIPGVPHMVPQQLVSVQGVSKTFSGVYQIMKVVHKLDTGGYDCELTLMRDASTGDTLAGKGEKPVDPSAPPQAPGGDAVAPTKAENPARSPGIKNARPD